MQTSQHNLREMDLRGETQKIKHFQKSSTVSNEEQINRTLRKFGRFTASGPVEMHIELVHAIIDRLHLVITHHPISRKHNSIKK